VTPRPAPSIVIPVRDEAPSLPALLDEVRAVLARLPRPAEIIVVDHGGVDDSVEIVRGAARRDGRVRLVTGSCPRCCARRAIAWSRSP
jgi:glycosyltransferase involved in cell wall biosynthesis